MSLIISSQASTVPGDPTQWKVQLIYNITTKNLQPFLIYGHLMVEVRSYNSSGSILSDDRHTISSAWVTGASGGTYPASNQIDNFGSPVDMFIAVNAVKIKFIGTYKVGNSARVGALLEQPVFAP